MFDMSQAAVGRFHWDINPIINRIPNPIIRIFIRQMEKILADSGYANVTITIV